MSLSLSVCLCLQYRLLVVADPVGEIGFMVALPQMANRREALEGRVLRPWRRPEPRALCTCYSAGDREISQCFDR